MVRIIDAHAHYMPPEVAGNTTFYKVNWSNIERQLTSMDENHIEAALLLYPTSDAHISMGGWENLCRVYNQEIARVVKNHKGRFIGAGILPIDAPHRLSYELKRIFDFDLKVISLASSYDGKYLDDDMFYQVYEFAQRNHLPVHVHPQIMNPIGQERVNDPLLTPVLEYVFDVSVCIGKMMMSGIFLKFPDVKFIFAHFGGVLPLVKDRFDNTYQMLRKRDFVKDISKLPSEYFKNLYFDVSGSRSLASIYCALEMVPSSHIFFGSDYPANQNVRDSIATIHNIPLDASQKDGLFSMNFLNLLYQALDSKVK